MAEGEGDRDSETAQQLAARDGEAVNQCPHCRAFRADKKPPTTHRTFCPDWVPPWRTDAGHG